MYGAASRRRERVENGAGGVDGRWGNRGDKAAGMSVIKHAHRLFTMITVQVYNHWEGTYPRHGHAHHLFTVTTVALCNLYAPYMTKIVIYSFKFHQSFIQTVQVYNHREGACPKHRYAIQQNVFPSSSLSSLSLHSTAEHASRILPRRTRKEGRKK